jgi:hypothetical protein
MLDSSQGFTLALCMQLCADDLWRFHSAQYAESSRVAHGRVSAVCELSGWRTARWLAE